MLSGACVLTNKVTSQGASSNPAAPPAAASSRLSVSSCLASRMPPAPIARLIAISLRRMTPRASSKPATFVQAISSTSPTTTISNLSGDEKRLRRIEMPWPPGSNLMCCSLNGIPLVVTPGGVLASLICCASKSIPVSACAGLMSLLMRPSTSSQWSLRFSMNFD